MNLGITQTKALDVLEDNETNDLLFGGAAGGGKSMLGCYWQIKTRMKYPKTKGLIGRAKLKTLRETTLVTFFKVANILGLKNKVHFNLNSQSSTIFFKNGSEILLKDLFYYPSDPEFDELGSLEITDAFVDECNQITEKAWNIVRSRIRHGLDENNLIPKILGTCNPAKNFVYFNFYKPFRDNSLAKHRKFIQSLVSDNNFISQHYVSNLQLLDEKSKQRLLHGNWEFDDDPSVLMQYEKIVDLFTNKFVKEGVRYITCDVARKGKDKTIIRVWNGYKSIKKVVLTVSKITEIATMIQRLQREFAVANSNTVADEDGVGGGLVDMLNCKGFVNNSRPLKMNMKQKNYANLRSQCYFMLAEKVNNNEMFLHDTDTKERENIVEEFECLKQKDIDKDGRLSVISRDEIIQNLGRSPDEASCIMMRMYFELCLPIYAVQ